MDPSESNPFEPADAPAETPPVVTAPSTGDRSPDAPVLVQLHGKRLPVIILFICIALEILWVVLDYWINYGRFTEIRPIRYMFSTTNEDGMASWFAISQTLLSGVTLWMIVIVLRAQRASWLKIGGWSVLATFFCYMAIDDSVTFHERMGTTYKIIKDRTEEGPANFPSYYWQIVFLPFFGAVGLFMLCFLWWQMKDMLSRILILAAIGLLVLAVAQDFVEGLHENHDLNLYTAIIERFEISDADTQQRFKRNAYEAVRHFGKSLEECLMESLANSLLWFLFLRYLTMVAADVRIRFKGREPLILTKQR
ncbi:MAG: hypothetical protein GY715_05950 [Planctomycetes bacterium]|nr:hypothetical protein [Planctomycetota bacterium]